MKRLVIFAGYDKHGIIDDYVVYYLKELKKIADIIFVYDNEFSDEELEKVKDLTITQICKKHGEYDFGSYKNGFLYSKENNLLANYDQLIFCNDSVYGPFFELQKVFNEMENRKNNDFWSMFFERDYKDIRTKGDDCQSYFLVFNKQIFMSDLFSNFIAKVTKLDNKDKIIELYELGLSQLLLKNGFKCDGYHAGPYNAPHDRRAIKIIKNGFPFLKRSLFDRKAINVNCAKTFNYKNIILGLYPNYEVKSIEQHLLRIFDKKDINYVLSRKFNHFNLHILHRKFIRVKGGYIKNEKYKFSLSFLGIRIIKIILPEKIALRKQKIIS